MQKNDGKRKIHETNLGVIARRERLLGDQFERQLKRLAVKGGNGHGGVGVVEKREGVGALTQRHMDVLVAVVDLGHLAEGVPNRVPERGLEAVEKHLHRRRGKVVPHMEPRKRRLVCMQVSKTKTRTSTKDKKDE